MYDRNLFLITLDMHCNLFFYISIFDDLKSEKCKFNLQRRITI